MASNIWINLLLEIFIYNLLSVKLYLYTTTIHNGEM